MVGSGAMFSDQFLDKEDNNKIKDVIFEFLTSDNFRLNEIDADDPEISDYNMVPVSQVFLLRCFMSLCYDYHAYFDCVNYLETSEVFSLLKHAVTKTLDVFLNYFIQLCHLCNNNYK